MSGTGRDHAGMEAGTTRSMSMGDQPGTAEVHSGIAFAPESQGTRDRAAGKVRDVADTVSGAAGNLGDKARSVAGNVGEKAGDLASQARSRVSGLTDRATTALDERGMLGKLRENPLPALGIAFAVGFLLAGGGRGSAAPGSKSARARSELRNALMAGVTAGLGQGARSFLRNLGAEDSVVNDVMQNLPGLGGSTRGGSVAGGGSTGRGGAMGGTSRGGSMGGGTGGRMASSGTHRPPSHQENF